MSSGKERAGRLLMRPPTIAMAKLPKTGQTHRTSDAHAGRKFQNWLSVTFFLVLISILARRRFNDLEDREKRF